VASKTSGLKKDDLYSISLSYHRSECGYDPSQITKVMGEHESSDVSKVFGLADILKVRVDN
jgi:hypothetical protein